MAGPVALSLAALDPVRGVDLPRYDPARLAVGIAHLGVGGFHRAHMARYTHDVLNAGDGESWGVLGVGLTAADRAGVAAHAAQDGLYTLLERQDAAETATVIGVIRRMVHAGDDPAGAAVALADPAIRIVSLTVTENGYCLSPASKRLAPEHPAIVGDLALPEAPRSPIGILAEAYRRRMAAGLPAFAALSCDNIQHNGAVLRRAVLDFAELRDPALARWIEAEARFPSCMVDRITPAATAEDVAYVRERYAIADRWPVVSEGFRQWVIEDDFPLGRPAWEAAGAQLVRDVAPYEAMKLRLLNASHLAIAGPGRLAGYGFVDETMRDAAFRRYMRALMDRETDPTVPPVPGVDLDAYKATLVERFANPAIRDTLDRINRDAPLNYLLDPIRERLARGEPCELLGLALAAWMRRARGVDDHGAPIELVHPLADLLRQRAREGGTDPRPLLSIRALFGDIEKDEGFVSTLARWLQRLESFGARGVLGRL